jgi:hypothetical protein
MKTSFIQKCNNCGKETASDGMGRVQPGDSEYPEVWCFECRTFWKHVDLEPLACEVCGKVLLSEEHRCGHLRMRHDMKHHTHTDDSGTFECPVWTVCEQTDCSHEFPNDDCLAMIAIYHRGGTPWDKD